MATNTQNPVIVDEAEAIVPKAVPETATVGVDVVAPEQTDKDTASLKEQLSTPEGVEKLLKSMSGSVGIGSSIKTAPLKKEAAADLAAQMTAPTLDAKLEEAKSSGKTNIAGIDYDAVELEFLLADEFSRSDLQAEMNFMEGDISSEAKRPFERSKSFYVASDAEDDRITSAKAKTQKYLADIDATVAAYIPEQDLRDVITRNMYRGVTSVTGEKLRELYRGTVTGIPYLAGSNGLVRHASGALWDSVDRGTSFFDEFASRAPAMEGYFTAVNDMFEDMKLDLGQKATLGRAYNQTIRENLATEVSEGRMTPERFEELAFVIDETTGEQVPREFFTEDMAYDLFNLAYDDLNVFGKIVATGADVGVGWVSWSRTSIQKSAKLAKKIRSDYKDYADKIDEGLKAGGKDPMSRATNITDMARALEQNGNAVKFNTKLLSLAAHKEKVDARVDALAVDVAKARANLNAVEAEIDPGGMARLGITGKAPLVWRQAKAAVDQAEASHLRATLGSWVDPITKDNSKMWAYTTMGQFTARELLTEDSDMDPQLAEFIGAAGMYFGGGRLTDVILRDAPTLAGKIIDIPVTTKPQSQGWLARGTDFIIFGKLGLLGDRTLQDYNNLVFEPKMKRKMNAAELRGLKAIQTMFKNSSQEGREKMLSAAEAYQNMINDYMSYVKKYAPESADEIEKNLHTAFYNVGDISRLAALGKMEMSKLNLNNLGRSPDLDSLADYLSDKSVRFADENIALLKNMFADNNVTGAGADKIIDDLTKGMNAYKARRRSDAADLKIILDDMLANYGKHPNDNVGEHLFEKLNRINSDIAEILGEPYNETEAMYKLAMNITDNIAMRAEDLSNMDRGPAHMAAVSRNFEDLVDVNNSLITARGKSIYEPVRTYFKNSDTSIDMSNFVEEFVVNAGAEGSISRFFSPNGAFFKGADGRRVARAFEDMVHRTIGKDTVKDLRKALIESGESPSEIKMMSDLQIALMAEEAGSVKIFSAINGEELDLMTRQMKSYAATTKNDALAVVAGNIANELDTIFKTQDKEGFEILAKARQTYRTEVFERRRKGSVSDTITSQREGPARIATANRDASRYTIPLGKKNALEVLDDVTVQHIKNVMYQGTDSSTFIKSRTKLQAAVVQIETDFGVRGGPEGRSYFDLDDPNSSSMFNALQASVTASVEASYGIDEASKINNALSRGTRIGATTVEEATDVIDFSGLNDILKVEDSMMVLVKKGDTFTEVPLADMGHVYDYASDLSELYSKNASVRKAYDEGLANMKTLVASELSKGVLQLAEVEQTSFSKLSKIFPEVSAPQNVYSSLILSRGATVSDTIDDMTDAMLEANKGMERVDAEKTAKSFLKQTVLQGLLERADVRVTDKTLDKRDKVTGQVTSHAARKANSPGIPFDDIEENYDKFVDLFGEEHANSIKTIFKIFSKENKAADAIAGRTDKAVNIRGILGKTYNLARQQVGLTYTMGDLALRMAEDARIDLYRLIASNEHAALITAQMLKGMPVKKEDISQWERNLSVFVATELQTQGQVLEPYFERLEADLKSKTQEEEDNDEQ